MTGGVFRGLRYVDVSWLRGNSDLGYLMVLLGSKCSKVVRHRFYGQCRIQAPVCSPVIYQEHVGIVFHTI